MKNLILLFALTFSMQLFSQFDFLPFEIDGVEKIYDNDDFYIVPEGKILVLYGSNSLYFRFKDNLEDYTIGGQDGANENFYIPPNYGVKPYSQNALRGILYDWNETTFLKDIKCFNKTNDGSDFSYTVPNGVISYVQYFEGDVYEGTDNQGQPQLLNIGDFLYDGDAVSVGEFGRLIIVEYIITEFNNSSLTYNSPANKLITPTLFPNPTTSKIALNSNKDYEIEIFDMTGNKVMKTSGNTIDLSVLSSAMYIVKTLDKMTKETNSYKVVKN